MSGWIKLHRNLKDWEYYDDHNATRLLIHLLVSVNYEDKKWKETVVKAGTMVSSWQHLAHETGLSLKQIRLAMTKLERVGEAVRQVAGKGAGKWQVISLVKWDKLQGFDDSEGQDNGQAKGRSRVGKKTPTKEIKKQEEKKEEYLTNILTDISIVQTFDFKKSLLSLNIPENIVNDWMKVRKNKKATNTEIAFNKIVNEIIKANITPSEAINLCVERSWSGFQSDWYKNQKQNNINTNTPKEYDPHSLQRKIVERLARDGDISIAEAESTLNQFRAEPINDDVQGFRYVDQESHEGFQDSLLLGSGD